MKIIHFADSHLDAPFRALSDREELGAKRRLEQREAIKGIINYAKAKDVDVILIAGDFFEHEYIRESTIDFVNELFGEIPDTKIFIVPGNHDPKLKNSYYSTYTWAPNVKIFSEKLERIDLGEADLYGYGFNNFEMKTNITDNIEIKNPEKTNIFISHGDIYEDSNYNPMNYKKLKTQFDYIALGHVHKRDDVYPGSLISLGFDEPGEHGFFYLKIENKNIITKEFVKQDPREFIKQDLDVTNLKSNDELIENMNDIETENNLYEIKLVGERNFKIEVNLNLIQKNIIKIKNNTKIKEDSKLSENENTLYGIFVKNLKEKLTSGRIDEETYEKVLETGRDVMQK